MRGKRGRKRLTDKLEDVRKGEGLELDTSARE